MEWVAGQIIGGLVGVAVTMLVTYLYTQSKIGKTRRAWRSPECDRLTVVLSTSGRMNTGSYSRTMTGLGPARSLGLLMPTLTKAYGDLPENTVRMSTHVANNNIRGDLVLLGGPKNNALTRSALNRIGKKLPVTMITEGDELIRINDDTGLEETIKPFPIKDLLNDKIGDYGIIIRTRNCFSPGHNLTIFAGTHTYGCIAAVEYYLSHEAGMRKLGPEYALVVKAVVTPNEDVEPATLIRGPYKFRTG
jgi:hypothetical protein